MLLDHHSHGGPAASAEVSGWREGLSAGPTEDGTHDRLDWCLRLDHRLALVLLPGNGDCDQNGVAYWRDYYRDKLWYTEDIRHKSGRALDVINLVTRYHV